MSYMFYGCEKLKSVDLSVFDTSLVETMTHMFDSCTSLTSIVINEENFDTSESTDFSYMFNNCTSLTKLNISSFKTHSGKDMSFMFSNCTSLTDMNIKIDINSVTNMQSMFDSCIELKYLDLSSFQTGKVNNFKNMFANTKNLTVLVNPNYCSNMIKEIKDYVNIETINDLNDNY